MTVQLGIEAIGESGLVAAAMPVESPQMVANPVNLVRSSRIPSNSGDRWVNGITYVPEGTGELGIDDSCSHVYEMMLDTDASAPEWTPYFLAANYKCSAFGWSDNDYAGRARRLLEAATPKLLEWEFWGGQLATAASLPNGFLAGSPDSTGAADSVQEGLAVLENELGQCGYGGRGMIHCPPYAVPFMGNAVRREGNLLLTMRDTIVVPGSGYATFYDAGPFDMYATGLTDVRLGDINVDDDVKNSFDRATNTVVVRAYRPALASWDQLCHAKVTVTLA
jgi:hypothetical protein